MKHATVAEVDFVHAIMSVFGRMITPQNFEKWALSMRNRTQKRLIQYGQYLACYTKES